jgi:proteic killer suppression protein
MAIISFRSRALKRLFENDDPRGISGRHVERIRDILLALDQAVRIDYMNSYPGWRLHALKGELRGFWSVSVSGNWRVISVSTTGWRMMWILWTTIELDGHAY